MPPANSFEIRDFYSISELVNGSPNLITLVALRFSLYKLSYYLISNAETTPRRSVAELSANESRCHGPPAIANDIF